MKALFPYVVMAGLFVAGNRLVDRQQQYNRTNEVSGKSASLIGRFTITSSASSMQLTSEDKSGHQPKSIVTSRRTIKNDQVQ